jgi:hypothetical protein
MSREGSPAESPHDFAAQYEDGKGYNPVSTAVQKCASEGEKRLREYLSEHHDRSPTEAETEWVRNYPRKIAAANDGRRPRAPTVSEMRDHFDWGTSPKLKKRLGLDGMKSHRFRS